MDKVSIIVPVYNASKTIRRCVDSILHQSYSNLEIILIDDGSIDNSLSICKDISKVDNRVKVFSQENSGVAVARNRGIDNSTGEWLMFIDSDDWIELNTVQDILELIKYKRASYGVYSFSNEYFSLRKTLCVDDSCYTPYDLLFQFQFINNLEAIICSVCNKVYSRSIIVDNNIRFDQGIKFGEDFIFNSKIIPYAEKIVTSSKPFYHYDCTIEDSGVKKLYKEWDAYILAMDCATKRLLDLLQLDYQAANKFRQNFVTNQWKYAFEVCINNSCSLDKKTEIIYSWLKSVPEDMWQWETLQQSEFGIFVQGSKEESLSRKEIFRKMKQVINTKKKKDFVIQLKQLARRMLKK